MFEIIELIFTAGEFHSRQLLGYRVVATVAYGWLASLVAEIAGQSCPDPAVTDYLVLPAGADKSPRAVLEIYQNQVGLVVA